MSSHISPDYLEDLTELHDDSLGVDWLRGFYDTYWGAQVGVQVETSDGRRAVCIPNRFDLPDCQKKAIVVWDACLELWQRLWRVYLKHAMHKSRLDQATILRGRDRQQALYFVLVAAAEARVPFVFHATRYDAAYVCLDAGAFFIPPKRVATLGFTARALLIVDAGDGAPSPAVWRSRAHVVIAAPPVSERAVSRDYHAFAKQRSADYFTVADADSERDKEILDALDLADDSASRISVIETRDESC